MFSISREENRLVPLEEKSFGDSKIKERAQFQEWLVRCPESLGEPLLIIQKEFDGFKDTKERLDVLALDKKGRLVVIENKLDDSGRDVVWQALKYVAYCSTLRKAELIEIYQSYLDSWDKGKVAKEKLCEFLEVDDLDEIVLNEGNEQRLVLIAANFRKEVTATVLWLIGHGIQAQCIRAMLYGFGDQLFIDFQQIIPTPDAEDYMIGMAAKGSEETSARRTSHHLGELRHEFWSQTLEKLRTKGISRFDNVNPSKNFWLTGATGISGCLLKLICSFKDMFVRVELFLSRPKKEDNKWLFDQLESQKPQIEDSFGAKLDWQRLDEKVASRICITEQFDSFDREKQPEIIEWICSHVEKLETACLGPLLNLKQELNSTIGETSDEQSGGTAS